jgi:hypothetical protein
MIARKPTRPEAAQRIEVERAKADILREVARDLLWFGAQGNLVEPDTAWAGVTACQDALNAKAESIERDMVQKAQAKVIHTPADVSGEELRLAISRNALRLAFPGGIDGPMEAHFADDAGVAALARRIAERDKDLLARLKD